MKLLKHRQEIEDWIRYLDNLYPAYYGVTDYDCEELAEYLRVLLDATKVTKPQPLRKIAMALVWFALGAAAGALL